MHIGNLKLLQRLAELNCPHELEDSFVLQRVALQLYRLHFGVYVRQDFLQVLGSVLVDLAVLQTQLLYRRVLAQADCEIPKTLSAKAVVVQLQFHDGGVGSQHFPQELTAERTYLVVQEVQVLNRLGLFDVVTDRSDSFVLCPDLPQPYGFEMLVGNLGEGIHDGSHVHGPYFLPHLQLGR